MCLGLWAHAAGTRARGRAWLVGVAVGGGEGRMRLVQSLLDRGFGNAVLGQGQGQGGLRAGVLPQGSSSVHRGCGSSLSSGAG